MVAIVFDANIFRSQIPLYAEPSEFSDAYLEMFWEIATEFADSETGCGCLLSQKSRAFLLNLLAAHLIYLSKEAADGGNGGYETSATVDKVSVTRLMPVVNSNMDWWLMQSPFGQQIAALLAAATAGGCTIGGRPEISSFRRAGGF